MWRSNVGSASKNKRNQKTKKYQKDNTAVVKMLTLKLHRNQSQETSEWILVEIL